MWRAVLFLTVPYVLSAGPLRVAVIDATRAAVAKAEVTLACASAPPRVVRADEGGVAQFADVPGGCQVGVIAPGFQPWRGQAGESQLQVQLTVMQPGTEVVVNAPRPKSPVSRFVNWLTSCTRR